eukprot:scaffold2560_cov116-Isochrysis_galbana.AAC.3
MADGALGYGCSSRLGSRASPAVGFTCSAFPTESLSSQPALAMTDGDTVFSASERCRFSPAAGFGYTAFPTKSLSSQATLAMVVREAEEAPGPETLGSTSGHERGLPASESGRRRRWRGRTRLPRRQRGALTRLNQGDAEFSRSSSQNMYNRVRIFLRIDHIDCDGTDGTTAER